MAIRQIVAVVIPLCLSSLASAQLADPPLVNWTAPTSWTPAASAQARRHLTPAEAGRNRDVSAESTSATSPLPFNAISPCRLVDTRHDGGAYADNAGSGETRTYDFSTTIPYTGTGACSVLPAAAALSLNLEFRVTDHSAFLTAYPDDVTLPTVANVVAYNTGLFFLNSAVVPTGADGGIKVFAQWGGDVVIDVNGYYAPTNLSSTPNPMQIAMLQWYKAADIPAHFTAGGDINAPAGLAFDGAHIWVANNGSDSVTKLNASDGSKVGTFTAGGDIKSPYALAFDGAHLWATNVAGNSVTELNASDGSKVGTFTAGGDLNFPVGLAFDGAHLWVANFGGNSVTELNASNGSKVGTFTAGGDISGPIGLAFDGAHIWAANFHGNSVTELDGSNGSKIGTFTAGGDINAPDALAFDGAHVWVANSGGGSVTELNASDGAKVGTFTAGGDINGPDALAFDGAHIWVVNVTGNSVTELNASDGSKVGTFTAGGDLNGPQSLAFDAAHIWVSNNAANSLDKL